MDPSRGRGSHCEEVLYPIFSWSSLTGSSARTTRGQMGAQLGLVHLLNCLSRLQRRDVSLFLSHSLSLVFLLRHVKKHELLFSWKSA